MNPSYIIPAAPSAAMILIFAGGIWIWQLQSVILALRVAKAEKDLRLAVEAEKVSRIPALVESLREKTLPLSYYRLSYLLRALQDDQ